MTTRDTMPRLVRSGNAAARYAPTDKGPKHHGPQVADDLASLRRCGVASANHAIRIFRETLTDLAIIARANPNHREWLARTLAPAIAACATPDDESCLTTFALAYANADARTEPALVAWLADKSEANWFKLEAAIRLERARGAELEGLGRARMLEMVP